MRTVRIRQLLLLAAVLFVSRSLFAGEPPWVEVSSPNFRVYTDAGEKRGRAVALHFEQMRFVFAKLFQRARVQTGAPVRVIAFRNTKEFRSVAPLWKGKPREIAGYYLQGDDVAFIALDLSSPKGWNTVFHEYAHLLLNSNTGNTQLWFDEGFAEYYSTARIEKSAWVIGSLPEYAPQQLANSKFIPLAQLFSATHDSPFYNESDHASLFYAESWLAVEYFWFDPVKNRQLQQYLQLVSEKTPVEEALKTAFGKDAAQLDKEFYKYFKEGKATVNTFKSPPALDAMEMTVRPVDALDARAVVSELRVSNERDYGPQAVAELTEILRQNPDQPVALRALGYAAMRQGDFRKARTYLDRAMALGADDPRVYFYWAMAVERDGALADPAMREKMGAALEKCIALDPQISDAYSLLAFVQAQGDFEAAIKSMKTAIALSPRKMENYLNMASLYLNGGKMDEASSVLQQLIKNSNEKVATQAQAMLANITLIKEQRAAYEKEVAENANAHPASASQTYDAEDFELKTFSGTLVKLECQGTKIIVTVDTGKEKLVLNGDTDEFSVGGKPLHCDMKGARVRGHYNGKDSKLIALMVE